jgi:hypothetical protein
MKYCAQGTALALQAGLLEPHAVFYGGNGIVQMFHLKLQVLQVRLECAQFIGPSENLSQKDPLRIHSFDKLIDFFMHAFNFVRHRQQPHSSSSLIFGYANILAFIETLHRL